MLVPVNLGFAQASSDFLIAALLIYSLAVLAFAGDYAFGRPRRSAAAKAAAPAVAQLATVGAGAAGAGPLAESAEPGEPAESAVPAVVPAGGGAGTLPAPRTGAFQSMWEAGPWVRAAVTFSALGMIAHVVAVTTRGLAVHRAPWGNMYEFITALTCVAAIFFGYIVVRYRAWALGVFVMGAVVVTLGLAETLIYTPAGPLVPALQSYWLDRKSVV